MNLIWLHQQKYRYCTSSVYLCTMLTLEARKYLTISAAGSTYVLRSSNAVDCIVQRTVIWFGVCGICHFSQAAWNSLSSDVPTSCLVTLIYSRNSFGVYFLIAIIVSFCSMLPDIAESCTLQFYTELGQYVSGLCRFIPFFSLCKC